MLLENLSPIEMLSLDESRRALDFGNKAAGGAADEAGGGGAADEAGGGGADGEGGGDESAHEYGSAMEVISLLDEREKVSYVP